MRKHSACRRLKFKLIAYIQRNHPEDYTFTVCHEIGEGNYLIRETDEDHEKKRVKLI